MAGNNIWFFPSNNSKAQHHSTTSSASVLLTPPDRIHLLSTGGESWQGISSLSLPCCRFAADQNLGRTSHLGEDRPLLLDYGIYFLNTALPGTCRPNRCSSSPSLPYPLPLLEWPSHRQAPVLLKRAKKGRNSKNKMKLSGVTAGSVYYWCAYSDRISS